MKLASTVALLCLLLLAPALLPISPACGSESSDNGGPGGLLIVNYVSYWWLDPTGYHPSMLLKVENQTGRDLTGERIRFQARFVNIRTGMVTIGREDLRKPFAPRQRIFVDLHGSDPFELPISTTEWPPLECKVMARIGDAGDEGTQTLVVADVDKVTMEDEEAYRTVEKMREYTQASAAEIRRSLPPPNPLKAAAASLKPAHPAKPPATPATSNSPSSVQAFLASKDTPGLGDDFAAFEKRYGLPNAIEKTLPGWTWASYSNSNPHLQVFAAEKGHNGVDVLMVHFSSSDASSEAAVAQLAKNLAGKLKNEALSAPVRSVRYLSAGRVELVSAKASGFEASCFTSANGGSTLVLSRAPGPIEQLMSEFGKHSVMLRPFASLFEI